MMVVDFDQVDRDFVIKNELEMTIGIELQSGQAGQVAQYGDSVIYVFHG
jgi:hypothetical protein